jgi:hypothetical protein
LGREDGELEEFGVGGVLFDGKVRVLVIFLVDGFLEFEIADSLIF